MFQNHILSVIVFFPLVVAALLLVFDPEEDRKVWVGAFLGSVVEFVLSLHLPWHFRPTADMQFVERVEWIPAWNVSYTLGIDGFSLFLILLTTFLTPLVIAASWSSITRSIKLYTLSFLLLETAIVGALCSLDLILFYVFWELMLVPMFLIIGIWGGKRRIYATVKFVLFTVAGSLLMLVAILALYSLHGRATDGNYTFDVLTLYRHPVDPGAQLWLFAAFALAFAIKVPLFPFHTWLPDAHVEAPTGGSVILAAVLLKLGGYGFIRFAFPLFPWAASWFATWLLVLSVIGILYGAMISRVQPDLKKLVAYSSISHLGFATLGIASMTELGILGATIGMLSHGLTTGGLFLMVGMFYERRHTRMLDDMGGLMAVMPRYSMALRFLTLASVGLPGLSGFVGEFLVLIGAFQGGPASRLAAAAATPVLILSAVYLLYMFQRVCMGPVQHEANRNLPDLNGREVALLAPLAVFILWMGIHPQTFARYIQPCARVLASSVQTGSPYLIESTGGETR